jgi:hypothetical protein
MQKQLSGCFCIVVLCLFAPYLDGGVARGQEVEDSVRSIDEPSPVEGKAEQRDMDMLSIGLTGVASPGGGDFFREYARLGGRVNELDPYGTLTLAGRMYLNGKFRVSLFTAFGHIGFEDQYNIVHRTAADTGEGTLLGSVDERLSSTVIPIMFGLEFSPIQSQFSSYVGVQGGVTVSSTIWTSTVRTDASVEFYRPGTNIDRMGFSPAFRAYTGVDLRFDRYYQGQTAFRGLFLEASFSVLPVAGSYFREIRRQGRDISALPDEDNATLNVGGFSVTLGINLQFLRK